MTVWLVGKLGHNWAFRRIDAGAEPCLTVMAGGLCDPGYWLERDDGLPVPLPPPRTAGSRTAGLASLRQAAEVFGRTGGNVIHVMTKEGNGFACKKRPTTLPTPAVMAAGMGGGSRDGQTWLENDSGGPEPDPPRELLLSEPADSPVSRRPGPGPSGRPR